MRVMHVACATQRPVIGTDAPREIDAPLEYKYIYTCRTRNLREIARPREETAGMQPSREGELFFPPEMRVRDNLIQDGIAEIAVFTETHHWH